MDGSGRPIDLTRRELIGASIALLAVGGPRAAPLDASFGEPFRLQVRRPKDALALEFEFYNAQPKSHRHRLERVDPSRPMTVVVRFPSQHVDEEAFLETSLHEPPGPMPVWSAGAADSRLCFDVSAAEIPLSAAGLLDWEGWTPRLTPEIVTPLNVTAPDARTTAIELPTRLTLSPEGGSTWRHAAEPVTRAGRTEVWHTRLIGPSGARPDARAIWSPDYRPRPLDVPPPWEPKITPLDAQDGNGFVHSTHVAGFDPEPIAVEALALSAAGGWLTFEKRWAESAHRPGYPISWKQRTALGRDSFVEVDRLAFLYPFGFKISVAKTSERKVQHSPGEGDAAFLRQHFTIKFEELSRDYDDWRLPYSRLIAARTETPYLDFPSSISLPGGTPDWRQGAFWPMVAGKPYEFEFVALDRNGRESRFTAPLLCVPLMNLPAGAFDPRLPVVQAEYRRQETRSTRPYFGQSVGFTQELAKMGTSHPVHQMAFDGELVNHPSSSKIMSPFEPLCAGTQISSAAGKALGGSAPEDLAWFRPADPGKTATEVYLVSDQGRDGALALDFTGRSDRAGGIAAPKLTVGGFARESGPFGNNSASTAKLTAGTADFLSDTFNPLQFLDADASILGVKLSSVLSVVTGAASRAAPQILSLFSPNPDGTPTLSQSFDWTTENLKNAPKLGFVKPILLTQQESPDQVVDPNTPTRFSLTASTMLDLLGGQAPEFEATGRLSNFTIQLAVDIGGEVNGVLLKIAEAWFTSRSGDKTQFGMELRTAEMIGPVLSFIQQLQEALAPSLSHARRLIDVDQDGVRVTLPPLVLPPISLGALDITDVRIASSASLPFTKRPPSFTFDFSSPDAPFIVAVGIFGGGGFVSLTIDTDGIQSLSAMFQFGGYRALELGIVRGRVFLFGGLYFSSERLPDAPGSRLTLTAFVHCGGEASVFSIVTVGVDFYVSLTYQTGGGSSNLVGLAKLSYSIKIGFFSRSATVEYRHVLEGSQQQQQRSLVHQAGSGTIDLHGPRLVAAPIDYINHDEWLEYREAFAA